MRVELSKRFVLFSNTFLVPFGHFFLLGYSSFHNVARVLFNNKVNQQCVYIYPIPLGFLSHPASHPTPSDHHKVKLSPCPSAGPHQLCFTMAVFWDVNLQSPSSPHLPTPASTLRSLYLCFCSYWGSSGQRERLKQYKGEQCHLDKDGPGRDRIGKNPQCILEGWPRIRERSICLRAQKKDVFPWDPWSPVWSPWIH